MQGSIVRFYNSRANFMITLSLDSQEYEESKFQNIELNIK